MPTGGDKADDEEFAIDDDEETAAQEKMDEDAAAEEMAKGPSQDATPSGQPIPALDEEQEYEWKWKVSLALSKASTNANAVAQDGGVAQDILPLRRRQLWTVWFLDGDSSVSINIPICIVTPPTIPYI